MKITGVEKQSELKLGIETAKQNQKFPFLHFPLRGGGVGGGGAQKKCKEIFWFLHTRVLERVRGALVSVPTQSERTRQFQVTTRSARAISSFRQDYVQNTFELCSIHTASSFENSSQNSLTLRYISKLRSDKMYEP